MNTTNNSTNKIFDDFQPEKIKEDLRKKTKNIRNISIIAHVDHGKTSLVDSLVSHNNIINPRLAGTIRYMDSLPDEQERYITMKTSSISILYNSPKNNENYYINVIDSPGHIDFASEIFTAINVCEGALLVIDVVEGVCSQTISVLKQAWNENIRLILVFNKLDRLITEINLTALETYEHLFMLLEKVNTILSSLLDAEANQLKDNGKSTEEIDKYIEEKENEMYFSPDKGNVIFSSALDGWAFSLDIFADIWAPRLNISSKELIPKMWGSYYLNRRTKEFFDEPINDNSKPLFVELALDYIFKIYKIVLEDKDKEKVVQVAEIFKLQIPNSDYSLINKEPKNLLRTFMRQWLPVAYTVFELVVNTLPDPLRKFSNQVERYFLNDIVNESVTSKSNIQLDQEDLSVSSMNNSINTHGKNELFYEIFGFSKDNLLNISEKDLQQTKCLAHILKMIVIPAKNCPSYTKYIQTFDCKDLDYLSNEYITVPFARCFSGIIVKNKEYFLIGPKYTLKGNVEYELKRVVFKNLFTFMGQHLEEVDEVYPGIIFSSVGIDNLIFKTALLSESPNFPVKNFTYNFCPLIKVTLTTEFMKDMPKLVAGLKAINRSEPSVDYYVQDNGEHILETLGEVHLERIVKDLEERLCKCKLIVSVHII